MKHFLKWLSLAVVMPLIMVGTLSGCQFDLSVLNNIDAGFDEESVEEPDYTFELEASEDKITISIDDIGYLGEEATVVALQPFQYLSSEDLTGVSKEIYADPYVVATYECGTQQEITIDRYILYYPQYESAVQTVEGNEVNPYTDGTSLKFYILNSDDEILAGPKYCSAIQPARDFADPYPAKSIKGVMCEDTTITMDFVTDLGCSWVQINFIINAFIIPNESYNAATKTVTPIKYVEEYDQLGRLTLKNEAGALLYGNVDFIDYNGRRFYFNLDGIASYDNLIKAYNNNGVKVTLILLTYAWTLNNNASPYMVYEGLLEMQGIGPYMMVNTANVEGESYWGATMEFLGKHYTECDENGNFPYGFVDNYVIGNEVDYAQEWNAIVPNGHLPLSMDQYMQEYERWIRIANQSLKKYYAGSTVLVSITHNWYTSSMKEYSPKSILDYMSAKTLAEGNYNWGIALHPYGADLPVPNFWSNDTLNKGESAGMNGSLLTSKITYTNLEVLQLYLEQPGKLCNGEIRSVHITEGGVCGPTDRGTYEGKGEELQAAGIAYAYYKSSQLSCVKSLQYYRLIDHPVETAAGLYTGIVYADARDPNSYGIIPGAGTKKLGYEVLKYIDNYNMRDYADQYIEYITWTINNDAHGYGIDCNTWQELMTIFPSRFDWETRWNEDLIWPETAMKDVV